MVTDSNGISISERLQTHVQVNDGYNVAYIYNTSSTEGFSIPINPDQELWVYRGIQPPNTSPIACCPKQTPSMDLVGA